APARRNASVRRRLDCHYVTPKLGFASCFGECATERSRRTTPTSDASSVPGPPRGAGPAPLIRCLRAMALSAPNEPLPRFLAPMLVSGGLEPGGETWAAEVKWEGMRAQVRFDGSTICARSRPGRDCTDEFPELRAIGEQLRGRSAILDGEL